MNARRDTFFPASDSSRFAAGLCVAVIAAFAPVLWAGFLNYDDPWLLVENPFFAPGARATPRRALTDFSLPTRLALGAEYLPVRDLFVWLETRAFGLQPQAMHAVSLALYAGAVLALYDALRRVLSEPLARASVLLFALHPVHVESVAWLSGQKDVLALLFCALALRAHAADHRRWLAPLWLLLACFSKAMSVAIAPLLVAHDVYAGRRRAPALYAAIALVVLASIAVHAHVGAIVGMVQAPAGGSRLGAAMTMGPVITRYLGVVLFPTRTSIVHEVPALAAWSWPALAGYALCVGWLALTRLRKLPELTLGWLWFFVPLAPVSQLLVPLQNRMADRYLWLSVLGPALVCASVYLAARARVEAVATQRMLRLMAALACAGLGLVSFERSVLFSDSVLLFSDALAKAPGSPLAPYQLGKAREEAGDEARAEQAFGEALRRRPEPPDDVWRSAANNLARIYHRRGEFARAEQLLLEALRYFPDHPKLQKNLAKVRAARAEQSASPPKT